jgi:hypothetical protein
MFNRTSIILLGSLLLLTAAWLFRLSYKQPAVEASTAASTGPCKSNSRLEHIQKLPYDTPDGAQAVNKLLDEEKESRECRDAVVNELMLALNHADLQNVSLLFFFGPGAREYLAS